VFARNNICIRERSSTLISSRVLSRLTCEILPRMPSPSFGIRRPYLPKKKQVPHFPSRTARTRCARDRTVIYESSGLFDDFRVFLLHLSPSLSLSLSLSLFKLIIGSMVAPRISTSSPNIVHAVVLHVALIFLIMFPIVSTLSVSQ